MRIDALAGLILAALLAGCAATPQARIERSPEAFAALPPEQQQRVKEGGVGIGFDESATRLAAGEPDRVIERETLEGNTQVWVYYAIVAGLHNDGYCGAAFPYYSHRVYCRSTPPTQYEERMRVVFKDGKVTSVERAR